MKRLAIRKQERKLSRRVQSPARRMWWPVDAASSPGSRLVCEILGKVTSGKGGAERERVGV